MLAIIIEAIVTGIPQSMNLKNLIGERWRKAIPATTTLAEEAMIVALLPIPAPISKPHHKGIT